MKIIPNVISIMRIIFSISLICIKPQSIEFYFIYMVCGMSDVLDGFIARKTGTTSMIGAKLDSIADMVMIGVLLFLFYPIINPTFEIAVWIVIICAIRVTGMIYAFKKYRTFISIHTYGNKFTGVIIFLIPIEILYIDINILNYVVCIIATISALEELIIQLISKEIEIDRKSIIKKRKGIYMKEDIEEKIKIFCKKGSMKMDSISIKATEDGYIATDGYTSIMFDKEGKASSLPIHNLYGNKMTGPVNKILSIYTYIILAIIILSGMIWLMNYLKK